MEKQYSLWIIPSPSVKQPLDDIILKLSEKYGSPNFEPHLALLGAFTSDEKTAIRGAEKLTSIVRAFPIQLGELSFSTTYFQAVFLRAISTAHLMKANLKAKEIFGVENNIFMPHISLLYGDYEMETREKAASEIKLPENLHFEAKKVVVVPSTQDPAEWNHLAQFPFQ